MNSTTSIFSQMLALIDKGEFRKNVNELKSDKYAKGFTSWEQFVSMLFCQLANAKSLREISMGLQSCVGKLNHLGMDEAPKRSTLSYANANRPWELFERTFHTMLDVCRSSAPGKKIKFKFKSKLFSLDATTIDLCLNLFPWAEFRQTKGAVKMHTLLDHEGYLPVYVNITEGKRHEINIAWELSLPKGSIVAMDRGYNDYALFHKWTLEGVQFVTRMKDNAVFEVVEDRNVPEKGNVLSDQIISLTSANARKDCPIELRLVRVWDEENQVVIELLTNNMRFAASTIAAIYKDRWEIEIFFKTIKQYLKIKTFVGTTANALRIQIWTALIAILMLKYLKFKSRLAWSMSNLVALVRWNLFSYRDLWAWIDNPFEHKASPEGGVLFQPYLDSIFAK